MTASNDNKVSDTFAEITKGMWDDYPHSSSLRVSNALHYLDMEEILMAQNVEERTSQNPEYEQQFNQFYEGFMESATRFRDYISCSDSCSYQDLYQWCVMEMMDLRGAVNEDMFNAEGRLYAERFAGEVSGLERIVGIVAVECEAQHIVNEGKNVSKANEEFVLSAGEE